MNRAATELNAPVYTSAAPSRVSSSDSATCLRKASPTTRQSTFSSQTSPSTWTSTRETISLSPSPSACKYVFYDIIVVPHARPACSTRLVVCTNCSCAVQLHFVVVEVCTLPRMLNIPSIYVKCPSQLVLLLHMNGSERRIARRPSEFFFQPRGVVGFFVDYL